MTERDTLAVNTLRFLAADAVEQANSGHPGMPMGAAPMAYVLWSRFLRFDPAAPDWFDRDRFILSAGHGSMLLYGLLHLAGYDLSLDEIRDFRQWGSITPGHPEVHITPGVEATTGPLGQGFANGVGMAMAERFLAHRYNRPDHDIVDHHIYAIVSDGDLMEGVAAEAASLAGHMKLGKLVYLYDDNHITIEGDTALAFSEDVGARFEAYGWHVLTVEDGEDLDAIEGAIEAARAETDRPSLIRVRTHIGYGSPKQDDASAHGEPLGEEALRASKEELGWPQEPRFHIPSEAEAAFRDARERGTAAHAEWRDRLAEYERAHPSEGAELRLVRDGRLPDGWADEVPTFPAGGKKLATRAAGGKVLNALARRVPTLLGGSADLGPSNKTLIDGETTLAAPSDPGRNIHFGVREHAMGAAVNGMALHGGVVPYGATFLIFSDYMKPSIRLAALSGLRSIFIFTHDSIGLGEDGPTHQPVEQLPGLRAIPGLVVFRPADANETAEAWRIAMERPGPVAFSLTRQGLPVLDPDRYPVRGGVKRGGYVLEDADGRPDLVLLATGSEVALALDAAAALRDDGVAARVVSLPSIELFREQSADYRASVLPADVPRIAIEAASALGWHEWVGADGEVIGLDRFGASAPGGIVMEKLGFSVDHVVERARALLGQVATGTGGD